MTIKTYKGVAINADRFFDDFYVVTFSDSNDMFSAKSLSDAINKGIKAIDKRMGR